MGTDCMFVGSILQPEQTSACVFQKKKKKIVHRQALESIAKLIKWDLAEQETL